MPHYEIEGREIPGTRHNQYDIKGHLAATDIIAREFYEVRDRVVEVHDDEGLECYREYQGNIVDGTALDIPRKLTSGN